jgi:hypothetical protein
MPKSRLPLDREAFRKESTRVSHATISLAYAGAADRATAGLVTLARVMGA